MTKTAKNITILVTVFFVLVVQFGCGAASTQTAPAQPDAQQKPTDLSFYTPPSETTPYPVLPDSRPKNVILCIGDGMGLAQLSLARLKATGPDGKLYIEKMPFTGLIRTHSANSITTDSAAAGTALASGVKTNNGMLGMTPDEKEYLTLLEAAKQQQMATGLVATSTITHATPAAFASHVKSRKTQDKIAAEMLRTKPNLMFGGGRQFFLPKSDPDSKRTDDTDLISQAVKEGYSYIQTPAELRSAKGPYVLGLFRAGPLTTNPPEPSLAELTKKAIEILSKNPHGFFLMVEGSQIDWRSHKGNAPGAVRQTLLFDQAVKTAIDFALQDRSTLVVVAADHETGGLIFRGKLIDKLEISFATGSHSALPLPVYAFGPNANIFTGVYDNTEIAKKIANLLGVKPFPAPLSLN